MRRARVAPQSDEADDGESYQDEAPPPAQPARRRGRPRRAVGHHRQQDEEPAAQDFDAALGVQQGAAAMPQVVPPM